MALLISAFELEFDKPERRFVREVALIVKRGEFENEDWVALENTCAAKFHTADELGEDPKA